MGDQAANVELLKIEKPCNTKYFRTPYTAERRPTDFYGAPFGAIVPQRDIASERQATITRLQEQAYDMEAVGKIADAADMRKTIADVRQMDDTTFAAWVKGR